MSDPLRPSAETPSSVCRPASRSHGSAASSALKAGIVIAGFGLALWFSAHAPHPYEIEPGSANGPGHWSPGFADGFQSAGYAARVASDKREDAERRLSPSGEAGKLDLNRSTVEELQHLPGIGPVLAARIVQRRSELGSFARLEDLLSVQGIGRARLARLAGRVVVAPPR